MPLRRAQGPDVQELAVSRVGVVMGVCFPLMLRVGLDVWFVIVFHGRVIVLVGMGRRHVLPLAAMPQVVHHVSVVVGVNDGVMGVFHSELLLVTVLCREPAGRPGAVLETPPLPERGWLGPVLPLGLVPGAAPGSCLAEMIWSAIGQVGGLGQAGVVNRGERISL